MTDSPPAGDGPLGIGLLCFIVQRTMEDRVLADLAAAGFDDLTMAQSRVMARIGPQGTRVTDLAEQARVTKQTVVTTIHQLAGAGYVRRIPDPSDARARLVVFDQRGLAALEIARKTEAAVHEEWTRHLGRRETERLHELLTKLREITDPYR
ncbi:DNA-binding transcriptional regulator, MarR family [Quadrisphaera granulorum]|uniref:DNA-binding MarR family transcriptional regulator n=1 Tax=Quadrisphaera granulorum TaxID=317664 RepID=A0A316ABI5_9ACTN|nr:DNA-binding MarR family transcriptional regulator [Quadrisphaera granulorum]SZE95888.1 DNA-binding transcriptional regulator, MarR family [Quadrisphaera granulorum]